MHKENILKMASGMLVLALLLSSLALLPGATVKGATADNQISFNVIDSGGTNITGVQAVLKEVHTLKQYVATTGSGGLAEFSPWPGYYTLAFEGGNTWTASALIAA